MAQLTLFESNDTVLVDDGRAIDGELPARRAARFNAGVDPGEGTTSYR
jgi:hypothetical protein